MRAWWLALSLVAALACNKRSEVVVFCAASLHSYLVDAAAEFQRSSSLRIRVEQSGSQVAIRKLSEAGMRADIVAVADASLIDKMMIPELAEWKIELASNEIVIAHRDHSHFTDEISSDNWTELLLRESVRLGCTNPDTSPLGYRTVFVWQLAGAVAGVADLSERLRANCAAEHLVPDENELVGLLESRAIDYAFVYRSTAESHHLKTILLPAEVNLSRPELVERYRLASVEVAMKQGRGEQRLVGSPITYGLTIPRHARNPDGAAEFAAFLLGERGRALLVRRGFSPLSPPLASDPAALPDQLRGLVSQP